MVRIAQRIVSQPAYPFAGILGRRREMEALGHRIIDLSIGDTVIPAPDAAVAALRGEAGHPERHHYSSYNGIAPLRQAIATWMRRRFGVSLDPDHEITALIGSKEGLFRFPQTILDPGDVALVPAPGYPVYAQAVPHAGGAAVPLPLTVEKGFLPELELLSEETCRRVRLIFVNFPANPTGAVADEAFFKKLYRYAERYDWVVCADSAYCEIYDGAPPSAALQFDPRRERTVEFFSFSKTYGMTGWRLGWACGNSRLVQALVKVKGLQDSAPFEPIQYAGIAALELPDAAVAPAREFYRENRAILAEALRRAGFSFFNAGAGFYLWAKTPEGTTSSAFAEKLLVERHLLVTPGTAFGKKGEGWFRLAVTRSREDTIEAGRLIAQEALP